MRKIKLVFLTCTWKRTEITNMFLNNLIDLEKNIGGIFEITNIVVDSDFSNLELFKDKDNFIYKNYNNTPLSDKWNYACSLLSNIDFDYVIMIGSDDIIDSNVLMEYKKYMYKKIDYIGILDMYVYDTITNKLFYWPGYSQKTGKIGRAHV